MQIVYVLYFETQIEDVLKTYCVASSISNLQRVVIIVWWLNIRTSESEQSEVKS